jgi:tRNA(Ile)-lysidine synthase
VPVVDPPVSDAEADVLFGELADAPALLLAVSGGPDSTALLALAARWAARTARAPKLVAATVDHGLRPEARREATAVKRLAQTFGIPHRTLQWRNEKPTAGIQEKARLARYELLRREARRHGARHVLTAHTLDDQAETILFRMARGSGIAGLAGMARASAQADEVVLVRPFLRLPKARLLATLAAHALPFIDDPSNRDPRFTRSRLRPLIAQLAQEGLDAQRLSLLALRMRRADAAIEAIVNALTPIATRPLGPPAAVAIDAAILGTLPAEVALRIMGRAIANVGDEGPVELGKLEAFMAALAASGPALRFRRTLAGAMITLTGARIVVERAPARRKAVKS